jgi:hypothetical protein
MTLATKQHFNWRLNQFVDQKLAQTLFGQGKVLPCSVVAVAGAIVTVKLELTNTGFVLPLVICPVAESTYVRLPVQVGDFGVVVNATTNIGNVSGLGVGTPDFTTPGNLAALIFIPTGNKAWATLDPNAVVITAPNGSVIRTTDGHYQITVSDSQVLLQTTQGGGASVKIDSSGNVTIAGNNINLNGTVNVNGEAFSAHRHSGVSTGSGDTGGVV